MVPAQSGGTGVPLCSPVVRSPQAAAKATAIIAMDSTQPSTRDFFIPTVVMPRSRRGIFIFQMATDVGARMMSR